MIETIFATDEEEMTPGTPEAPQEGGEGMEGGEEAPTSEPQNRLDGEEEESEGDKE